MDHLARSRANGLVSEPLDRGVDLRHDEAWLSQALQQDSAAFVPVFKTENLFTRDAVARAQVLSVRQQAAAVLTPDRYIFLGSRAGRRYFAVDLIAASELAAFEEFGVFGDLRQIGLHLDDFDAALLAYARGMVYWHSRHRYCGVCGVATEVSRAGHLRSCPGCATQHFPRTDPAVIVLAHRDERCLLGRKPEWPAGRYSTIAGFVEPGESAEHAVVREVQEETGVLLDTVAYHSSQPWPFPSSIMLGFHATVRSADIQRHDEELEDARWFTRRQVQDAVARRGPLRLPPRISIARRLIEDWLRGRVAA